MIFFIFLVSLICCYYPFPILSSLLRNEAVEYVTHTWIVSGENPVSFWKNFNPLLLKIALTKYMLIGILLSLVLKNFSRLKRVSNSRYWKVIPWVSYYYCLCLSVLLTILVWIDVSVVIDQETGIYIRLGYIVYGGIIW